MFIIFKENVRINTTFEPNVQKPSVNWCNGRLGNFNLMLHASVSDKMRKSVISQQMYPNL